MNLRVAYDISFLAEHAYRSGQKIGIGRVMEEVLQQLHSRSDVEATAVGLCGGDPVFYSCLAARYVTGNSAPRNLRFSRSFTSRWGWQTVYEKLYHSVFERDLLQAARSSPRAVAVRGTLKLLKKLDAGPYFDSHAFDVFHSPAAALPARELTRDVPRVLTIYDLIPVLAPEFVTAGQTAAMQHTLDSIDIERDWIICISEYTKQEFCAHMKMSGERVFVAPLAAAGSFRAVHDAARIAATRLRYGLGETPYFLSLAALQPRKNLVHLIRCFFQLRREHPALDVNLVLVGPKGWMYNEIFAAAGSGPEESHIIFTDYVADEDLSALYSGARVFVYPSLYEGFGLPPLEAMQCGVPVITSNTTSLPEVVGDAGLMVAPNDGEALCGAMLRLLTDSRLREELSAKALERCKSFSWTRCADDTVKVYQAAAGEK